MSDHFRLPLDIWRLVGLKLDAAVDRIRFSAVCKSWASLLPSTQPPWLMLSEPEDNSSSSSSIDDEEGGKLKSPPPRGFVSVGEERVYEIDVPHLHQARCVGSTGNWLIAIDLDHKIFLLNPFSKGEIHLPCVTTVEYNLDYDEGDEENLTPKDYRDGFIWKIVLSSPPSHMGEERPCVTLALHHYFRMLSIARPGDSSWTTVQTPQWPIQAAIGIEDAIFYKQQFYALNYQARLLVCDIGDDLSPPKVSFLTDSLFRTSPIKKHFLVEWSHELLMVIKIVDSLDDAPFYRTNRFELYKFDSIKNKFDELKSLGDYSLFLGYNTSTSVLASNYPRMVKRNCIYFTDNYSFGYVGNDMAGGHDMGIFDLEDKSITPHYKRISTSFYSPPIWIIPN